MTTTTYREDYLGRWLGNTNPGTSAATDFLGRTVLAGNKDFLGRALAVNEPAAWATGHTYTAGDLVKRKTLGTAYSAVYQAVDGGTSHASTEPTWPTAVYGTVVDNAGPSSITWRCVHV